MKPGVSPDVGSQPPAGDGTFAQRRSAVDARLLEVFDDPAIRRTLTGRQKLDLPDLAERVTAELGGGRRTAPVDALAVHRRLVKGLPGVALFVAAALAFDSLTEALPFFDVTAKTARSKLESALSPAEGDQALRLARAATLAGELLGSAGQGRRYLHTPNFALGGATPLELLKTGYGEPLVLGELQAQAAGGPV
ncbi:MAG TPA: antitoxin Xre/MbcA/ParS toxin-binding domain-containing protein [Steroidobacteraceae bacterium]|nr:antitoxin Xre/MbcA/ParS toxin-binding domain-containing protein [Steroidobacteraceae bacterium]